MIRNHDRMPWARFVLLAACLPLCLLFAACSGDDYEEASPTTASAATSAGNPTAAGSATAAPAASPSPAAAIYPVTIENCGQTLTITKRPTRVVGIDQISTELLLHLGVGDDVVGTANQSDPPFPAIADAFAKVPVLSANYPVAEQLVSAQPDFIVGNLDLLSFSQRAGFGGPFTREELTAQGVGSFALVCMGEEDSNELLFERFIELGRIFGEEEAAMEIVEEARETVAATVAAIDDEEPVPALIYLDGRGPIQTLTTDLSQAGGANIVGPDEGGCCPPTLAVEVAASRNPAAILLSSFGGLDPNAPTAEQKKAALKELLPTTSAVQDDRYLSIDFIAFSTPHRLMSDIVTIAAFLHPEADIPGAP